MKITTTALKPRNPLVAAAHFRRAGTHQSQGGAQRQQQRHQLRRELDRLTHRKDSP